MPEKPDGNWLSRLTHGLTRSSTRMGDGLTGIFTKRKLDDDALEELEELLISADLGPSVAGCVVSELARTRFGKEVSDMEIRTVLAEQIERTLTPVARPLVIDPARKPYVILMAGVNGAGKTTTIGKLADRFKSEGRKVVLAAGDTFRAAAVEQLEIWGKRAGAITVTAPPGSDAAAIAFKAHERAVAENADILMIDTAGRLHNKAHLMAELEKIVRVLKKRDPEAPHSTLLVLDAGVGQNALAQTEIFGKHVDLTGMVLAKLDGSAKGGVLVALADRFGLPVHLIGVGETPEDLESFDAGAFARALAGLEGDA